MSKHPPPSRATTQHVRDHCLCLNVQRAARLLARHFDEAFRPLDLTNGQFSLLMSLNRPEPPTLGAIAALLAMDRTTLTAALKPLARRGLIAIEQDTRDRRNRRPRLTAEGGALLGAAAEIWRATHDVLDAHLANAGESGLPDRIRTLSAVLQNR